MIETLGGFAPQMELYSIDEAFLDLHNMKYTDLTQLAWEIRETELRATGIPVSIGIAPSKTLAKIANCFAKKTKKDVGSHGTDTPERIEEILRFTAIGDVWGIGSQHTKRLTHMGIHTAYDLLQLSEGWMRDYMTVVGQRMLNELKIVSCIPLNQNPPLK